MVLAQLQGIDTRWKQTSSDKVKKKKEEGRMRYDSGVYKWRISSLGLFVPIKSPLKRLMRRFNSVRRLWSVAQRFRTMGASLWIFPWSNYVSRIHFSCAVATLGRWSRRRRSPADDQRCPLDDKPDGKKASKVRSKECCSRLVPLSLRRSFCLYRHGMYELTMEISNWSGYAIFIELVPLSIILWRV